MVPGTASWQLIGIRRGWPSTCRSGGARARARSKEGHGLRENDTIDGQLQRIWDEMFDRRRLRDLLPRVGIQPDDVITMLRYAPLALTHLTWRNTVLEEWHAQGRIHDPDMFRANAETSLIFDQALWSDFGEQVASGDLFSLDDAAGSADAVEMFQNALYDAYDEAFDAERSP